MFKTLTWYSDREIVRIVLNAAVATDMERELARRLAEYLRWSEEHDSTDEEADDGDA